MKTSLKKMTAKRIVVRLTKKEAKDILHDLMYAAESDLAVSDNTDKFVELVTNRLNG